MSQTIKNLLIIGPSVFGFVIAMTTPVVQLHFIKLVEPQVFAFVGLLYTGTAAIMQSVMSSEKFRRVLKRIFVYIVVFDCVAYATISVVGMDNTTVRFIGITLLEATSVSMLQIIMCDSINASIAGSELTTFEAVSKAATLWATLAGGVIGVLVIDHISIDIAVSMQCAANCVTAVSDYSAYKRLG